MHYDLDPLLYSPKIILERYCLIGVGLKTLNFLGWVFDKGLTPTKDGGTCLRRLSMFRKEVH